MTNSNNDSEALPPKADRLDRIERILEAVAQQQQINTRTIDLLGQRVDSNAKAIEANSNRIADVDRTLAEAVGRALAGIEALTERAEEDRVNFREYVERTDAAIAGINATLAVLQQLMRYRDGNQSQP